MTRISSGAIGDLQLVTGDIEIGAVEIKNSTDDTRASVGANGLYVDVRNIQAGTNVIGHVITDTNSTTAVTQATASNLNASVVGAQASGAAQTANPVLGGGVYNHSQNLTAGQVGVINLDQYGDIITSPRLQATTLGDTLSNAINAPRAIDTAYMVQPVVGYNFNGTTWDRNRGIINATNSTGTGIQAVGLTAQLDDTSPTAVTENQFGNVRMSAGRAILTQQLPEAVITYYPSSDVSTAYEASSVSKNAAGALFQISGYSSNTSGQFIQVFNSTTVPADTTAPILTFYVPGQSNFSFDFPKGKWFSTGISWSNSTTGATKTLGAADCYVNVEYI